MPSPARSLRILLRAVPLLALTASGCVVVHHYPEPTADYRPEAAPEERAEYAYRDGHVIPAGHGGGWCFLDGVHYHVYAPDYPAYYGVSAGLYVYQGPVSFFFFGFHPVPHLHGGGTCRLPGRHVHRYHPHYDPGWRYHPDHRYYFWDGHHRRPARGWHPAEPAYRTEHPRHHDARPVAGRPGRPAVRPAPPAGAPAHPTRARPVARPATPLPGDACDQPGRCVDPRPDQGRDRSPGQGHPGVRPAPRSVLELGPIEGTGRTSPPAERLTPVDRGQGARADRPEVPSPAPGRAQERPAVRPGPPVPQRDRAVRDTSPVRAQERPAVRPGPPVPSRERPATRGAPDRSPRERPATRSVPERGPRERPATRSAPDRSPRERPATRSASKRSTRDRPATRSASKRSTRDRPSARSASKRSTRDR